MPYRIGTASNSPEQIQLLEDVKTRKVPAQDIVNVVLEVLNDSAVSSGEEELHPDWEKWANTYSDEILNAISPFPNPELRLLLEYFSSNYAVSGINPHELKITFLLGAGASKPSDIPTVSELLPDLLARARRLNRDDLNKLADFCDDSGMYNIEDLLTAVQLANFSNRNSILLRLIEFLLFQRYRGPVPRTQFPSIYQTSSSETASVAFLQDTLQVLFGLLSNLMLPKQPNAGHLAISRYVKEHLDSTIVTTNYDCCMDLALSEDGEYISYLIDFTNNPDTNEKSSKTTSLIKLHGSLNWFYCDTCQSVNLIDIKRTVDEYNQDKSLYPVIAVCKECGGQRRGLLVPPLAMKFDVAPPLTPLIEKAQESFNKADLIVVVGFSFADADLYISRMVTKALQRSHDTKLLIFDPVFSVREKMRQQLSNRDPKFDKRRVIGVPGSCDKVLPFFLDGNLHLDFSEFIAAEERLIAPEEGINPFSRPRSLSTPRPYRPITQRPTSSFRRQSTNSPLSHNDEF